MERRWIKMILFIILLLTAVILTVVTVLALSAGGAAFIVLFGDVIVCIALIVWIMRKIFKRR